MTQGVKDALADAEQFRSYQAKNGQEPSAVLAAGYFGLCVFREFSVEWRVFYTVLAASNAFLACPGLRGDA